MPAFSSNSVREATAAYFEYSDYDALGDAARAASFITAARQLLLLRPSRIRHGQSEVEFSPQVTAQELKVAIAWLNRANGNAGSVRFLGVGAGFRG